MFKCDICGKEKNENPHVASSLKVQGARVLVCNECHENAMMEQLVNAVKKKEKNID